MASTPSCERFIGIGTTVLALILFADDLAAQGLPVETASHVPVGVWFIGAAILGLAIAYGIMRNRSRTRAEKQITEEATKSAYINEERDRIRSRAD